MTLIAASSYIFITLIYVVAFTFVSIIITNFQTQKFLKFDIMSFCLLRIYT